jgi:hypothetical protein
MFGYYPFDVTFTSLGLGIWAGAAAPPIDALSERKAQGRSEAERGGGTRD